MAKILFGRQGKGLEGDVSVLQRDFRLRIEILIFLHFVDQVRQVIVIQSIPVRFLEFFAPLLALIVIAEVVLDLALIERHFVRDGLLIRRKRLVIEFHNFQGPAGFDQHDQLFPEN